ncbi:MAG TPA: hypothetical protein VNZ45_10280 [Bacteroidia bacterium]|jgi:hypothetical protein|nr:hypothetical protein [Bacteroidia bacterium]
MSVYRFKVYFEDDENVFREIEIKAAQTFEDLHRAIQKAINFDDAHPASFFISNDTWRKGKEIKLLRDKKSEVKKELWMHEAKIAPFVEDPHQKVIYEFDPQNASWIIFLELMKILPDAPVSYPRVNKSVGNPPPQYKITTPVEVVEDDDEETAKVEEEDNYVKTLADHFVENEGEEEVEREIKVHAKAPDADVEDGVAGEEGASDEAEDETGFEEEEFS